MAKGKKALTPLPPLEAQQLARNAFRTQGFLSVNKELLSKFGPELAVYIGNLADKHEYFHSKNMLEPDGAFFLTHKDQTSQTGMAERALRRCKKQCRDFGIILWTDMRGAPPKEFYGIDFTRIQAESSRLTLLEPQGLTLLEPQGIIKETRSKENKENNNSPTNQPTLRRTKEAPGSSGSNSAKSSSDTTAAVQTIVDHWNTSAKKSGLPEVVKATNSRRSKLAARIQDYGLKNVRRAIRIIHRSAFCCGENDRGWQASIDFLARPDTVAKALEGTYNGRSRKFGSRRIIDRSQMDLITEDGEPMHEGKWYPIDDSFDEELGVSVRTWEGPEGKRVKCDTYPDPYGDGNLIPEAVDVQIQ